MIDLTATDRRLGDAWPSATMPLLAEVADEFAAAGVPVLARLLRERGTKGASELLTVAPLTGTLNPASDQQAQCG
ncbi:Uncharacterised protein [Nocardia otitidiscaviarum]|uniref:Uncharacterized protein n=1 Tax=Nocardia otitidiscaviarum TaxID=1823 RepID=A0A379JMC5_9NOCA|nr:hypothetical protein [Nocardia otitidiscaviarum]SUD49506.1 Uncharacterised protein [Nocardia otitidiscaviarum]